MNKAKTTIKTTQDKLKIALYNLAAFVLGGALVKVAYGNYQYAHLHRMTNMDYKLSVASSALIGAIGVFLIGKWLINKPVEIK